MNELIQLLNHLKKCGAPAYITKKIEDAIEKRAMRIHRHEKEIRELVEEQEKLAQRKKEDNDFNFLILLFLLMMIESDSDEDEISITDLVKNKDQIFKPFLGKKGGKSKGAVAVAASKPAEEDKTKRRGRPKF